MTPLQQRMIEDMTVRGLVPSTQRAYLRAVRDESREMLGIMPQPASPLLEGPCPDTNAER